jgi:hypothetical protein
MYTITTELAVRDESMLMERGTYDDVWNARKKVKELWWNY